MSEKKSLKETELERVEVEAQDQKEIKLEIQEGENPITKALTTSSKRLDESSVETSPKKSNAKGHSNGASTLSHEQKVDEDDDPNYRSEIEKSGFFTYLNFLFVVPIFKIINKPRNGPLTTADLPRLGKTEKINDYSRKLLDNYVHAKKMHKDKASLVMPLFRTFKKYFLLLMMAQALWCGFKLTFSIFLNKILSVLNNPKGDPNEAYMWAGFLFIAVIISTYAGHHGYSLSAVLSIRVKQSFVAIIYMKVNNLSSYALNQISIGKIVNLAANDINVFERGLMFPVFIIVAPFALAGGIGILWGFFGASCLVGIGYLFLTAPMQNFIARLSVNSRKEKNLSTDERIRLTNEIIDGIRLLKMYTWDMKYKALIEEKRKKEIDNLKSIWNYENFGRVVANSSTLVAVFLIVVTYTYAVGPISSDQIFPTLILIQFLRQACVVYVMYGFNFIAEVKLILERIKSLLDMDEMHSNQFQKPINQENDVEFESFSGYWSTDIPKKLENQTESTHFIKLDNEKSLTSKSEAKPSLDKINISIKKGTLTAIIGRIGSGKSTLLLSLMSELPTITGSLRYNGNVAYVEQEPIIFPGIFRDNILFGKPYESEWYDKVVKACCLVDDLKTLANGDMTEIGEKGINLSGGQKARVALARAIYSRSDIYLLDDPLSAVDTKVAKALFENAIKGLLAGKTVLLATHQVHFIKETQKIIILHEGKVIGNGNFEELKSQNIDLEGIFQEQIKSNKNKSRKSLEIIESKPVLKEENKPKVEDNEEDNEEDDEEKRLEAEDKGKLFTKEDIFAGQVTSKTWWTYLRACCNPFVLILMILSFSIVEVSNVMFSRALGWISIGNLTQTQGIGLLGALVASYIIFCMVKTTLYSYATLKGAKMLHDIMLQHVVTSPCEFFDTNPVGRVLNRFSNDVGVLDRGLPLALFDVTDGFFYFASIFVTIWTINPIILVPGVVAFIFYYLVLRLCRKGIVESRGVELVSRSPMYSLFSLTLSGLITVRAYRQTASFIKNFLKLVNENAKALYCFWYCSRLFGFSLDLISVMVTIVGLCIVISMKNSDQGLLGLSAAYLLMLNDYIQWILRQYISSDQQMASTARVLKYTEIKTEAALKLPNDNNLNSWPSDGRIILNKVFMKYRENMDHVIKGLTLSVESGEKIGCVGRTGAGKSSIIQLLFRMIEIDKKYAPDSFVKIDNIDTMAVGLHTLREKISIIPQTPFVFSGTIRRNLDPFLKTDDKELWLALEEVNLKTYVQSLKNGLDTDMSNAVSIFSVGQKQLICLARAILKKNKILVLDEATANVDLQTDIFIQKKIMERFNDCTIFTIAHRLSTIAHYDKVMVMDKGNLVEFDAPFKLLVNNEDDTSITCDGYFASMVLNTGPKTSKNIFSICKKAYDDKKVAIQKSLKPTN